jgi:hypothetical protein
MVKIFCIMSFCVILNLGCGPIVESTDGRSSSSGINNSSVGSGNLGTGGFGGNYIINTTSNVMSSTSAGCPYSEGCECIICNGPGCEQVVKGCISIESNSISYTCLPYQSLPKNLSCFPSDSKILPNGVVVKHLLVFKIFIFWGGPGPPQNLFLRKI